MPEGRFVAYFRVSTAKQGQSGLGLEAQRDAVLRYLNGGHRDLLAEFVEIESGKRTSNRPQLAAAMDLCRLTGATLVIAKLDRLSRDAHFLIGLDKSGVDFVAADMPDANRMTVHLMAVIAQGEREMISRRTKDALAQSKKKLGGYRGKPGRVPDGRLGSAALQAKADTFAALVLPTIAALKAEGNSLRKIAAALQSRGVLTSRRGTWDATKVRNVLARAEQTTQGSTP